MLKRFTGQEGRARLVEVFRDQELVRQNSAIAQQLAEVAKLKEYKKEQEVFIEGQPGTNRLYFILSGEFDLLVKGSHIRVVSSKEAVGEFPILDHSLPHAVTLKSAQA
jgi:CRP-like cAMP-binding protein